MKSTLLTRLKRLETVRAVEESNRPLKFEFAYLKLLPREYHGPRHRVKVGRLLDGNYRWEERPGPAPANEDEDYSKTIIRINLVEAKHGQLSLRRQGMKSVVRRLSRLEDRFAHAQGQQIAVSLYDAGCKLALDYAGPG